MIQRAFATPALIERVQHTATPWEVGVYDDSDRTISRTRRHIVVAAPAAATQRPGGIRIVAACGDADAENLEETLADAHRIVAAMHACEGIHTLRLEHGSLKRLRDAAAALLACAGQAEHWTDDEREGASYLRSVLWELGAYATQAVTEGDSR